MTNNTPPDMVTQAELLPCPFCGGIPVTEHFDSGRWQVSCGGEDCLASITWGSFARKAEAITAWNTRLSPPITAVDAAETAWNAYAGRIPGMDKAVWLDGFRAAIRTRQSTTIAESEVRLREAIRSALTHIKRARDMVPDDDEGLASDIFARAVNHADNDLRTALQGCAQTPEEMSDEE